MAATGLHTDRLVDSPVGEHLGLGHAVNQTLASIAGSLDPGDPHQMAKLRAAADAAHTLHATVTGSPIRARALGYLEELYGEVVGAACPLRAG